MMHSTTDDPGHQLISVTCCGSVLRAYYGPTARPEVAALTAEFTWKTPNGNIVPKQLLVAGDLGATAAVPPGTEAPELCNRLTSLLRPGTQSEQKS